MITELATVEERQPKGKTSKKSAVHLELGTDKKPLATIHNFLEIMQNDNHYAGLRYNMLTQQAEIHVIKEDGELDKRDWKDSDDSASREYIEHTYKLHNVSKHDDALKILFDRRAYNPLINLVESLTWDGENRCEHFLTDIMKAANDEYTREVSRLIFAGGINRLYNPGCKFDVVPILIGTKQGEGKSSICAWLAIRDEYSATTRNLTGDQRAVEAIQGAWICEIPELAAFKVGELEEIKAFLTLNCDKLRMPYARRVSIFPRRAIFIGSSNTKSALVDKTGNRRFYPVEVHSDGAELHSHEKEVRAYINQCWAEARDRFKAGKMPAIPDRRLADVCREAQEAAVVPDWRIGCIQDFLNRQPAGGFVCLKLIWDEALFQGNSNIPVMRRSDQTELATLLDHLPNLERCGKRKFAKYGQQVTWRRTAEAEAALDKLPFED